MEFTVALYICLAVLGAILFAGSSRRPADETAFFDEDMVDSPAHFTADDKAAVAVIDRTAGDQEVAAGFPVPASVGVFSGFDTDCVIADVKG